MVCDNSTNGTGTPYTLLLALPMTVLVGFLILLIIFGNVLVIIAVFTSRALRAPQNLFLVSLASADILVATLVMPFSLANELMGCWAFGQVWCEIYLALDVLFCTASITHLCAISLDRYWSITQAIEYNLKRTPQRIKRIIFIVWIIAAVISFPPLITMKKEEGKSCKINEENGTSFPLPSARFSCLASSWSSCTSEFTRSPRRGPERHLGTGERGKAIRKQEGERSGEGSHEKLNGNPNPKPDDKGEINVRTWRNRPPRTTRSPTLAPSRRALKRKD